jgi:hypothetical protein
MFNISIFTSKLKSNAEDFLLRTLAVGELKELEKGILICVDGVEYFIQARMILTILDTIGFEDYLKVQTNQSIAGCYVCFHGKGYNYLMDRIVFIGHRELVSLRHYLRNFGMSRKCCHPDYYKHSVYSAADTINHFFEHIDAASDGKKKKKNLNNMKIPSGDKFIICDKNNTEHLREFLLDADSNWDWYHVEPEFDMHIFENDLYFHNCDYRPFKPYRRKSNQQYVNCNEKVKEKVADNPKLLKKNRVYQGVKGNWPLTELSYSNVETDVCWGPMHCLGNVCANIIENWKGERIDIKIRNKKKNVIEYCRLTGTHPDLYTGKEWEDKNGKKAFKTDVSNFKWEINEMQQKKVFNNKLH